MTSTYSVRDIIALAFSTQAEIGNEWLTGAELIKHTGLDPKVMYTTLSSMVLKDRIVIREKQAGHYGRYKLNTSIPVRRIVKLDDKINALQQLPKSDIISEIIDDLIFIRASQRAAKLCR